MQIADHGHGVSVQPWMQQKRVLIALFMHPSLHSSVGPLRGEQSAAERLGFSTVSRLTWDYAGSDKR